MCASSPHIGGGGGAAPMGIPMGIPIAMGIGMAIPIGGKPIGIDNPTGGGAGGGAKPTPGTGKPIPGGSIGGMPIVICGIPIPMPIACMLAAMFMSIPIG